MANLPPRPPGGGPPRELPPAGQRRLPDGRRPDHLWSVLHSREDSQPPNRRALSREEGRRESRSLPSRPEDLEAMPYPAQLPPLGWSPSPMPGHMAPLGPIGAMEPDWRDIKANLRPRIVSMDGAEAKDWMERRLENALTEQRSEMNRRFGGFEQSDKHFKDWVQREHEQLHSQLQQLRVSLQETASQQQRLVGNLTAQGQKQDMRLQELEGQMAQALAQVQGVMNAVSAGALGAGNVSGGTGEAAMGAAAVAASASANLEVLRAGLEREAQARVALGSETAEQLKQISDMVYELNNRQQQQQASVQQHQQQNAAQDEKDLVRYEARFAALEPSVSQLREELEEMRKLLYRCGADCAKRCEENEEMCNKRLGGVQEAALNAARELWEEHQGVVVECKSSLSALQQILDSKDKIALQLRSLQQQQREEDKQEFWTQIQVRHEQLQAKLADAERSLLTEQNTRIEEQQRNETVLSRLGLALEKAQAAWLRDSAKLSEEIHEAKRDFSIEMDGETRGVARRLADGLETQQRQMDELDRKLGANKTELGSVLERLDSTARSQQQELRDAEGRLMRQINDVQTIQGGRTQQAVFDMKAELAKQEQVTTARLSALQKGQDELEGRAMTALNSLEARTLQKIQDSSDLEREKTRTEITRALEEERTERLRMDEELREEHLRHLAEMREQVDDNKKELNEIVQNAEERLVKRLEDQVTVERTKTREQIEAFIEEERSERLKAEAERLTSLQKRLQAHEELTSQRLAEQRARWETEVETLRQRLEAQALKDKQDLNKDLQDFVQEERQVTNGLSEDMRILIGDCQSLAESFQKHQLSMEQRLANEAAALAAQLGVSTASLTSQLGRLSEMQQLALETKTQEIKAEMTKVSDELDKMNGEILKLIDDESDKVKEKHLAMESRMGTLEMAFTARTAALGEQDAVLQERLDEVARQNGEAIEQLRYTMTSETGKVLEHFGRVQEDVKAVEAEALRRCEETAEAQSEAKMEMDNMFGTFQANLGELGAKIEDVAISQASIHTEIKEQLQSLVSAQEKETLRANEAEQSLLKTSEGLAAQVAHQNGEHLSLLEKHKELGADVDRRFADLQAAAEAEKATMATQHAEEQKAAEEALAEMSKSAEASQAATQEMLAEMSKTAEGKLQEEKSRAIEAEAALREGLAAQASQAAAQAAAQAQAQAAQAEEAVRQGREAEELRKQIAEHSEKLEAVQGSCNEAKQAAEKYKEETTKAIESVRDDALGAVASESKEAVANLENKLAEANTSQNEMKEKLEQLQKTDEDFMQALSSEEQRARRAEEALEEQLAEAKKVSTDLAEKVEETKKHAEKAEAEAKVAQDSIAEAKAKSEAESKAADQSLEEELGKLKKASEEDTKAQVARLATLEQQLQKMEETEKKAVAEATEKDAGYRKEQDQHKADLEEIKKRLKEAENKDEDLKREATELRDLQGKQQEEQSKATQEVQQRQQAAGEELKSLDKKLEELSGMKDAAAKSEELVQSCQAEVTILQEKLDQEVGTVRLRMEGGFKALLQRLEAQSWLRENVDTVADGVSNSFLRLLDKSSEKLKERVDKLEAPE